MKIGNFEIKNKLILAPMAGVTDVAFRDMCVFFGADYAVTEMISAKALKFGSKKTQEMLNTGENEKIKVVQIFGSDADVMAGICKSKHLQKFDIIDINMGCPANKIVGNNEGSSLMKNIELAKEIVTKCVQASQKPITVKFRKGWDDDSVNAVEFAKMCEQAGASAITVHARTKEQGYSGKSDLDIIKEVKENVSIPVIGNGDVTDKASFEHMLSYTKCDAVMIGRGALGSPEIFSEICGLENTFSKFEIISKHVEGLRKHFSDKYIVKHMRKHFLWYLKGVKHSAEFKSQITQLENLDEVLNLLKKVLN